MAVNINVINVTIEIDGDALLTGEVKMNEQCVNVMLCIHSLLLCHMETKSATSEENKVKSQHIFSKLNSNISHRLRETLARFYNTLNKNT